MRRLLILTTAALAAGLLAATPAAADDTVCPGALGPVTVEGNLLVPAGSTCTLLGTRVEGNVRVEAGARLRATRSAIRGNLECRDNPAGSRSECRLLYSTLRGNAKLRAGVTFSAYDTDIGGNVQCERCDRADLSFGTRVTGNVKIQEATQGSVITGTSPAPRAWSSTGTSSSCAAPAG